MRSYIKSLLGEEIVYKLRSIKNKFFNNKSNLAEAEINERKKVFYSTFIKKGDLCFDVGANMGRIVQPMLENEARVIAIEPQESCRRFLKMKYNDKITIIPKGLGSKEEVKDFYISDSNTISSFSEEWIDAVKKTRFKNYQWNTVKKVEITTLDKLIEAYGTPAFIKIDVEGYELEVLKGLTKPVGMISFEYTVPEQTQIAIECIKAISRFNPSIECNYSFSDTMEFSLKNWEEANQFIRTIESKQFISSGMGDIYVRTRIFTN